MAYAFRSKMTSRLLAARTSSPLRNRASSLDEDRAEGHDLEFEDKDLEQRWREQGFLMNMRLGCQQLMLVNSLWMLFSSFMLLRGGSRSTAFEYDIIFLIVESIAVVLCLNRPSMPLYFVIITVWFVFALCHGVYPWSHSCEDLAERCAKYCERGSDSSRRLLLMLATFNMDCSLQGHTTVDIMMATLLLSPRLIPSARLMHLNWAFIVLYIVLSLYFAGELAYNSDDLVNTVIILCFVILVADRRKFFIEKGQRQRFFYDQEQQAASKRIFNILEYMVPMHVIVDMLKNPGGVIAWQKDEASVLFIMIEDFDQHARHLGPEQLMEFLNRQFTMMDQVCSKQKVTKIETVGEEYMCAVGVVPDDEEEAAECGHMQVLGRLIKAAADILAEAAEPSGKEGVTLKLGMHTGPVVAGVIGQKLPRFRLFGDTVNTAARMMQKGNSGCLQFGEETRQHLPKWVEVDYRGKIEMKGKGEVDTYLFKGISERRKVQFGSRPPASSGDSPSSPSRMRSILKATTRRFSFGTSEPEAASPPRRSTVGQNMVLRFSTADEELPFDDLQQGKVRSPNEEEKFQRVLSQLRERSASKVRSWKWWFSFFLRTPDFTSEIEDKWQRWYHDTTIRKKLESRLDKQALALFILTAVEVFCCTFIDSLYNTGLGSEHWRGHDSLGWARLPVFLSCRGLAWLIIWIWQNLARAQHRILRQPHEAQLLLSLSFAIIAVLVIISYDAIAAQEHAEEDEGFNPFEKNRLEDLLKDHKRASSVFSLMLFPVYIMIATQHQFRFLHTFVFWMIPVCMAVTWPYFCGTAGRNCNLYMSMASKMLMCFTSMVNSSMAWSGERNSRSRFLAARSVQITKQRIDAIASTLMPPLVVEEMRCLPLHAVLPSHKYKKATIAQSDLCGFTKLASTRSPKEVVQFIGELFGNFDALTDKHQVYKVETVGDAYIAGQADPPLTQKNHPVSVVLFGLEMVSEVHSWAADKGWSVSCRVGIAHGACIGGIVGTEMQRYHLFGELMSALEVLESTAPEGCVQVSTACKEIVEEQMRNEGIPSRLVSFEPRDLEHLLTSKGDVIPLEKAGGPTFVVRSNSKFQGWIGS